MTALQQMPLKIATAAAALMLLLTSPHMQAQTKSDAKKMPDVEVGLTPATADGAVAKAAAKLRLAESELEFGQKPLPGERSSLVNGHSRLNSAYFERIKRLEAQVQTAMKDLQLAYAKRNALSP